jgi:hypothetical protein
MTKAGASRKLSKSFAALAELFLVAVCGPALAFTVIGFIMSLVSRPFVGSRDFVIFWATGEQAVHYSKANPYDGEALMRILRSAGIPGWDSSYMYMRNMPSALPLVYPLGFLGYWPASILWSMLLLACLAGSVHMLWQLHGRPRNRRHWLGYSFGPALVCMTMGQTSLFALFGLVLFLRLHRTRPFLAGASLWLCALKPQLFLTFGVVLLAWVIVSMSYRILIGAVLAIAASCAIAFIIDPAAWTHYEQMMRQCGIEWEFIPCVSFLLRNWISPRTVWLQCVPAALGCLWGLAYFWPRRQTWDWIVHGSPLMLVSLVTAPYSYVYDACVVIPALLQGAYATRSRIILGALALLSALIEFALLGDALKPFAIYLWTLWSAPAWLVWYLFAARTPDKRKHAGQIDGEIAAIGD